jgi:ribosomal protein L18
MRRNARLAPGSDDRSRVQPEASASRKCSYTMSAINSKNMKRTYHPAKTFDDDLDGFAELVKSENWSFSGIDAAQIGQDAADQRKERLQHDAAEAQFDKLHETFGLAQEARHDRFSAALNAARGAFRSNKAVLAQIERFRRSTRKASKAATEPQAK